MFASQSAVFVSRETDRFSYQRFADTMMASLLVLEAKSYSLDKNSCSSMNWLI